MDSISADARLTAAQIHSIIQQALEPLTARIDHQHAQLMIALAQLIPVSYCPEPPTEFKTEAYHQCHAADSASSIVADSGTKQSTECSTLAQNPLRALFDGVEGQRIRIPSVDSLCPSWPVSVNPNLEAVRGEFTAWVNQWFAEQRIRQKIEDLDAPYFAAMAYPRTGRTELLTLAKFIAWYFPWDDAIDDASMMQQPDDIIRYKNETISVIQQSLGPDHRPQSEPHPNPAIQSFWDIGTEIRAKGTLETNQLLIDQQSAFITSAALSQIEREYSHPVTVEEYLKRRETNIAIYPLMALSYYAYNVAIPTELLPASNTHMRIIWTELARMGTMANDLLSMRREVMHGQFESLVPLMMYHNDLGVQAAVDRGTEMIHESYHRFDQAEQELYHEVSSENLGTVKAYLAACKDLIMCNLHWSYGLKRYMEKSMVQEDGSVVFQLRVSPPSEQPTHGSNGTSSG